jgi:hypothetical protein
VPVWPESGSECFVREADAQITFTRDVSGAVTRLVLHQYGATGLHAQLLTNGSFEQPVVPVGGFTRFGTGSTLIPGWTVVGATGVAGSALRPVVLGRQRRQPERIYGTSSTVNLLVNRTPLAAAINAGGAGTTRQAWQQFMRSFAATGRRQPSRF